MLNKYNRNIQTYVVCLGLVRNSWHSGKNHHFFPRSGSEGHKFDSQ